MTAGFDAVDATVGSPADTALVSLGNILDGTVILVVIEGAILVARGNHEGCFTGPVGLEIDALQENPLRLLPADPHHAFHFFIRVGFATEIAREDARFGAEKGIARRRVFLRLVVIVKGLL